jgi:uncharacterized membrane protein
MFDENVPRAKAASTAIPKTAVVKLSSLIVFGLLRLTHGDFLIQRICECTQGGIQVPEVAGLIMLPDIAVMDNRDPIQV